MIKVLFICWGNVCRSPMAKYIMLDMVKKRGLSDEFFIDSAGISSEETGNAVYPPARRELLRHNIPCDGHMAKKMRPGDYYEFDYIIGAEKSNVQSIRRMCGGDPDGKVYRMLDWSERPRDIPDPWYTGNFGAAYDDICEACGTFIDFFYKK